jgi:hypothetical protein
VGRFSHPGNADVGQVNSLEAARAACALSPWSGRDLACQWCDADLTDGGRRKTWCSDKCRLMWERNHVWSKARSAARRRGKYQCGRCGAHKTETGIEVNHIHPVAAHADATHGRQPSCAHHQSNLEVLCHACHVVETSRQRKQGLLNRSSQPLPGNLKG